jgi:gamma-glutamyl hercynylcysteine S-oxide synthase
MAIAGLPPAGEPRIGPVEGGDGWLRIPAARRPMGASEDGFAYDNERPRHMVELPAFRIARRPVTNASWMTFSEGGGYERREWWSNEGWAWKEEYDIGHHPAVATGDPEAPVCHVSWFEADAFARAHGLRLPTETEWEKAATWDQEQNRALAYPWGDQPTVVGLHANMDQLGQGPEPAGALTAGASPYGCLGMLGDVWEWTATEFRGYPGFRPYPYREYSEVFFGGGYRVLRGGSWATRPRVGTSTFRNWDLPQRRQIFSGLRIARDR